MIFVISLGNIVVSRICHWAEQKHWQNAFPDDFWTWPWLPTLIWRCVISQYWCCHPSGQIRLLMRGKGLRSDFYVGKVLPCGDFIAFGKMRLSPFKYRSIPGGNPQWGLLSAAENVVMQGTESTSLGWKSSAKTFFCAWSPLFKSPCGNQHCGPQKWLMFDHSPVG